jgi:hypothetical protein
MAKKGEGIVMGKMLGEAPPSLLAGFYYLLHCLDVEVSLSQSKKKKKTLFLSLLITHGSHTSTALLDSPHLTQLPSPLFNFFHRFFTALCLSLFKTIFHFYFLFLKEIKSEKRKRKQWDKFAYFFLTSLTADC